MGRRYMAKEAESKRWRDEQLNRPAASRSTRWTPLACCLGCASHESCATNCPSPNVSQGGRGAAKSSSIRQRSELNIRKSSYGPSPADLLAVLSPNVSIFCQGKTEHSPNRPAYPNSSGYS